MKNTMRCLGIIAIVAVIAFTFAACGGDDDDNGDKSTTRDPKTYTGTAASGVEYTLKIEDGSSRAVLTPKTGDKYTLTQTANSKKSTGTVTKVVGGELTLAPKEDPEEEFTATVSGNGITAMSGDITWDDGSANTAPATLTPPVTNPGGGDSNWTWTAVADSTFGTRSISKIAYGNNRFFAVWDENKMAYSSDNGATWTPVAEDSAYNSSNPYLYIRGIAYGNNTWVAVGTNSDNIGGTITYSTDNGETWTNISNTFGRDSINAVAYGNNKFVAVGNSGKMATSTDGASWTAVSDSKFGNNYVLAIAHNGLSGSNGRFVAVGTGGKMAYSDNGETWTAVSDSTFGNDNIRAIAYGNNRFVAVGDNGKPAYSANGVSWTAASKPVWATNAIAYGNNRFVAVGGEGEITYSTDGASWTAVTNHPLHFIYAIAYGNGRFVAGGGVGRMAYADW